MGTVFDQRKCEEWSNRVSEMFIPIYFPNKIILMQDKIATL